MAVQLVCRVARDFNNMLRKVGIFRNASPGEFHVISRIWDATHSCVFLVQCQGRAVSRTHLSLLGTDRDGLTLETKTSPSHVGNAQHNSR